MGEHAADAGGRIADELQRLCCAETEGEFFDFVTEAVSTICSLLRERDDLLAALKSLLGQAEQTNGIRYSERVEMARAAIAKAEGVTSDMTEQP